ncbi:hypothetical protein IFR05_001511 [Cadophora sp. M221]|nr:hypothetical protein IFR05_001511 [Cadophora sp. M221]
MDIYNRALEESYDKYFARKITYEETDLTKVRLFFARLGLPELSMKEVGDFPVETLVRLCENGYRLVIVTNGQIEDQAVKAEAIGIRHLIDRIFTSEEVGCCKPDRRIFKRAIEGILHETSPQSVHMVGDSAESDVKGALDADLQAILYSPMSQARQTVLFGEEIPVITHMDQLLDHLHIPRRRFELQFLSPPGWFVIKGMGIDLVTEHRHCMSISKDVVKSLAENMSLVLLGMAEKRYEIAMTLLEDMIRMISKVAMPIDETAIEISFPGQGKKGPKPDTQPVCTVTICDHSICVEVESLSLVVDSPENKSAISDVAKALQAHFNNLMGDYSRAAVRDLRTAMMTLARKANIQDSTIVRGEKIDE